MDSILNMDIKIDGPYGNPVIIDAYRKIIIIVNDIGFTGLIQFFDYMLNKAIKEETQISIDLLWFEHTPKIFLLYKSMLKQYKNNFDGDPDRLFDIRLFYTSKISKNENIKSIKEYRSQLYGLSLEFTEYDIDLTKELSYIDGLGTFTLVLASGTSNIINKAKQLSIKYGSHFRQELLTLY